MFTFNIGPSQLTKNTKNDIVKSVDQDILQLSHRSSDFTTISQEAIDGLREYLKIPRDYKIFYTDSATRAMDLAVKNTCKNKSFHFCNGAFSNLFAKIARSAGKIVKVDSVNLGEKNNFQQAKIDAKTDFIAMTHTETSSGVMCSKRDILAMRKKYPKKILAVDITSSAGAVALNFRDADIWFFSVQKCFGLPAGLGIIIVSPVAYQKSLRLMNKHQNFSFENMWGKMGDKYQTVYTPNVFGIYLLAEKLKRWNRCGGLKRKVELTKEKVKIFSRLLAKRDDLDYFVKNKKIRAETLFYIKGSEKVIQEMHNKVGGEKIILGKGYGKENKKIAIRIANFPAISKKDLRKLSMIIDKIK